jgi:dipeptidyl aminopeptidase/acylaminoacyl peptidase
MRPWFVLLIMVCPALARADRNIVYSARYYYPPGDKRISRFHLYRIRPDGTGRMQLTFGNSNDYQPRWSPSGDRILFWRGDNLCTVSPQGGKVISLLPIRRDEYCQQMGWSPDSGSVYAVLESRGGKKQNHRLVLVDVRTRRRSHIDDVSEFAWSPDGTRMYLGYKNGTHVVTDRKQSVEGRPAQGLHEPIWLPDSTIAGVDPDGWRGEPKLRVLEASGTLRKEVAFSNLKPGSEDGDLTDWNVRAAAGPNRLICALNEAHGVEGTRRVWGYYLADTVKSTLNPLYEGSSLSLSSNAKQACAVPPTSTTPYGSTKVVYAAPLQILALDSGKVMTIVKGLVWVWSADWRKAPGS